MAARWVPCNVWAVDSSSASLTLLQVARNGTDPAFQYQCGYCSRALTYHKEHATDVIAYYLGQHSCSPGDSTFVKPLEPLTDDPILSPRKATSPQSEHDYIRTALAMVIGGIDALTPAAPTPTPAPAHDNCPAGTLRLGASPPLTPPAGREATPGTPKCRHSHPNAPSSDAELTASLQKRSPGRLLQTRTQHPPDQPPRDDKDDDSMDASAHDTEESALRSLLTGLGVRTTLRNMTCTPCST